MSERLLVPLWVLADLALVEPFEDVRGGLDVLRLVPETGFDKGLGDEGRVPELRPWWR